MKIIISERQKNLITESKKIQSAQNLIDMAVEDYVESCGKMQAFTNIQSALCKGLGNGNVFLKVINVSEFSWRGTPEDKTFRIHMILYVDKKWMLHDSFYENFENSLGIKIENILGVLKYVCYIDDVKMNDEQ